MSAQSVKTTAFWSGVAYFLCPLQKLNPKYNRQESSWTKDKGALAKDWANVSKDFYHGINSFGSFFTLAR